MAKRAQRPLALRSSPKDGQHLLKLGRAPPESRSTWRVVPDTRSRTKTSRWPFVSPGTRLGAVESKSTRRPSRLMAMTWLVPAACCSCEDTLTRRVLPVARLRTNTSRAWLVSARSERLVAVESNATVVPSAETTALVESPFA